MSGNLHGSNWTRLLLAIPLMQPLSAQAQVASVTEPPRERPGAPVGADAEAILRSLGVQANQSATPAQGFSRTITIPTGRPSGGRETPIQLRQNAWTPVMITVGAARTLVLPGEYDRATLVLPNVAEVLPISNTRVQILGQTAGTTDIVFTNTRTGDSFRAQVVVTLDVSQVQAAITAALPRERITATPIGTSIVLGGSVRDPGTAAQAVAIARRFVADPLNGVVNNIQVLGGQQVMLQVRVAEVNRNVVRQFGLNSSVRFTNGAIGNANISGSGGPGISPISAFGDTIATIANPVGFVSTRALGGVLNSTLQALESDGLVRLLAEPNLTVMSGQTANFLAGQQYPIPVVGLNGTGGTEYRNFGVSLNFTPTVLGPNNIALNVMTEVSTRAENVGIPSGNNVAQVPIFNTRRASTSVELPSGSSLAIAGLIQSDFQNAFAGFPGIRNIPILGRLFSSTDFQRRETELVIIVTPYLVEAVDANTRLSSPSDGLLPPSNLDLYFFGRLTGNRAGPPHFNRLGAGSVAPPPPALSRNIGFVTE